jgi:two-component system, chemotaxis family, sensor kinase CheA
MPTQDEEFAKKLRATFKVEAEEHLQMISSMLLELEKSPLSRPPMGNVESVYREAHSLKGAARAVDFAEIEAICQAIESVFAAWKRELTAPSPDSLDALHHALDMINALLESPDRPNHPSEQNSRNELIRRLDRLQLQSPPAKQPEPARTEPARPAPVAPPIAPSIAPVINSPPIETENPSAGQTVRIPIDKLDSHLLQAEDMLGVKAMTVQRAADLREVTGRFERWQREWAKMSVDARVLRHAMEHQNSSGIEASSVTATAAMVNFLDWNFDYLRSMEDKLISLTAQAEQDRHSVGKRVDDLLENSKKLLMLPFSTVSGLFPKLIRDLCRDQGKEAEIVVKGGEVEIDKRILEEMKDALIHVLRNCVDHGVESAVDRQRLGKPARAQITVAISSVNGNKVEILVSDDGAGVDLKRVKESAVRHGIISPADAVNLGDAEALNLIFYSEVSASPAVTSISGRGLGMAIVRAKTEKLGGRISVESKRESGTTLRMLLPLTLTTFRGVLVTAADRTFVVPTVNVERVLRVKANDIQTVENRQAISLKGRLVSLARLDTMLELAPKPSAGGEGSTLTVIVLHVGDQRVAFVVDEVLREEEVLVKPLRKPLVRVRNIAGATLLGSGKVVPVLNVTDLIQSARTRGAAPAVTFAPAKEPQGPAKKILVVEDSITSRMLLKGILESGGYQVRTAVDGMDAFAALREDEFDLVVSDVEMPRMNGLDLASRIRADKRLSELPVVLVTALETREERECGMNAGASAYIVKSSFDQSNLLEAVQRLV